MTDQEQVQKTIVPLESMLALNNNSLSLDQFDEVRLALGEKDLAEIAANYQNFFEEAKIERVLHRHESSIRLLHTGFHRVLDNEASLHSKLTRLKNELRDIYLKHQQALKLSSVEQKTRADLLEELDKAWSQASLAKSKEKRTLETLSSLKLELFNLSKLVEQGVGFTMGQEFNLREIIKEKENLIFDNNNLSAQINETTAKLNTLEQRDKEYLQTIEEYKLELSLVNQELLASNLELQKTFRKNEQLDEEVLNQKRQNEYKETLITKLELVKQGQKNEIQKHELSIKDLRFEIEKVKKELEIQNGRFQKVLNELDQHYLKNDALMMENSQSVQQVKKMEELVEALRVELIQTQKKRDLMENRIKSLEEAKRDLESDKATVENLYETSDKLVDKLNKEKESEKRVVEALLNEKDQLSVELSKVNNFNKRLDSLIRTNEIQLHRVEHEKRDLEKEINKLKTLIASFDKERNSYLEKLNDFALKLNKQSDELKLKELSLSDGLKKLNEYEIRLDQMQRLYENVRTDRNLYSKNLLESQEEITTLKQKTASLNKELANLSSSCKKREGELNLVSVEKIKLEKSFNQLRAQLDQSNKEARDLKKRVVSFELEREKLVKMVNEVEEVAVLMGKKNEQLLVERNVLGSQLVRRNDEVYLLREKIRLLEAILKRGEIGYKKLVEDSTKARLELVRLRRDLEVRDEGRRLVNELKRELVLSERDLLVEKAKRNAVEAMRSSLNAHPWRKMKACEPSMYELVVRVSLLQKRLIAKSEQVSSLHLRFQEKDRMFVEIKRYFSRRVNECIETSPRAILEYKYSLTNATKQLKCMLAENNMLRKLNDEQKRKLDELSSEVKEIKTKPKKLH